jgi:hypothetical protein
MLQIDDGVVKADRGQTAGGKEEQKCRSRSLALSQGILLHVWELSSFVLWLMPEPFGFLNPMRVLFPIPGGFNRV